MESGRLRVLIADSEPRGRQRLSAFLGGLPAVEVVLACDDPEHALLSIAPLRADIVFVDASILDQGNADLFKRTSENAAIVVVATDASLAFLAFESQAVDYLVKPYSLNRVVAAVAKAARMRGSIAHYGQGEPGQGMGANSEKIVCTQGRKRVVVKPSDVVYAIARGNYVELNTEKGPHLVRATFSSVLAQLGNEQFLVANRSVVVRRAAIRWVERFGPGQYSLALSNGARVRTSRNYRTAFRKILDGR